jgi:peptidoglycan/LPS O-acetylase OafA/YrhL
LSIRYPDWSFMRALNVAPVRFLGTLSYSLYLTHQVVLYGVWRLPLPDPLRALLTFVGSLLIAVGIFRYVEKPFAKLRGHFSAAAA